MRGGGGVEARRAAGMQHKAVSAANFPHSHSEPVEKQCRVQHEHGAAQRSSAQQHSLLQDEGRRHFIGLSMLLVLSRARWGVGRGGGEGEGEGESRKIVWPGQAADQNSYASAHSSARGRGRGSTWLIGAWPSVDERGRAWPSVAERGT